MLWDFSSRLKYLELKNKNLTPCISIFMEVTYEAKLEALKMVTMSAQKVTRKLWGGKKKKNIFEEVHEERLVEILGQLAQHKPVTP